MLHSKEYNNSFEEIISHYPLFYRDVLEIRAIIEAEGRILDGAYDNINRLLDNAFIDTADIETIERFERFLRIKPKEDSSFEERRRNVKLYFTGFGKISATTLKQMLFPFTETEAQITFAPNDEYGNNMLSITIPRGEQTQISYVDLMDFLARRIPAHLWFEVNIIQTNNANLYFGFVSITLKEMDVTSAEEDVTNITYLTNEKGNTLTDEQGNILIL